MAKVVQIEVQIRGIRGAVTDADSLKKAIKATNEELGKTEFGTQAYKRLQDQLGGLKAVQKQVRDDTRKSQQAFEAAANSGTGSYRALNAELVKLRNEFKSLSKEERDSEIGVELTKRIQDLDKELKDIDASIGQFQRNVGNYGEAILGASKKQAQLVAQLEETRAEFDKLPRSIRESEEAQRALLEITDELEGQIEQLGKVTGKTADDYKKGFLDNLGETEGVAGGAVRGVKALGASFKALLANPVVAVISLIVASLSALFGAFTKTQRGANFLAKAVAVVSGIFSELIGVVDSVVDSVVSFSKDPVQGLKDFGQALVTNVINRFKGLVDAVGFVGKAIGQLITGNLEGLKQTAKDTAQALIQIGTGLDVQQQKDFASAVSDTTKELGKNIDAWAKLGESRRAVLRQNLELQRQLESIITTEQLLASTADDATKSFAEREEAAEKARAASEARAAKELQIARNNLGLINQELKLRQANGEEVDQLLQDQLSGFQALSAAERDLTLTIRDNEKTRAELKQDRLERDLDILIDGFDNQKTINERILQDDRVTLDERQRLLEETERLANESFQRQIETIQQFTGVRVDANKLVAESDTIRLNEQIRSLGLSEIIEGRLLEVIRERRLAVQDLTEAEATLNEEAANVPIQAIEAARDLQIAALVELGGVAEELSADRELIEARANERILQQRLSGERLNNAERAALELELAEQVTEIQRLEIDKRVDDEVAAIQARRDERLKALFAEENKEKVSAEKIAQIRLEAEADILQARLSLDQVSARERLALEVQLQEARKSATDAANSEIGLGAKNTLEVIDFALQKLQDLQGALSNISQARLNKEVAAVRKRYDAELELAEGNEEEQQRLREEFDERKRDIEQAAFERGKKLAILGAVINGASAVVSTLAASPGFGTDILTLGILRGLQVGFVVAQTAAQIAAISSQTFEGAHGLLIPELAEGGTVTMNTTAKGRSHAAGHIKTSFHGQPVRIENGEFVTKDEHGNVAVINKQSSRMHAGLLNRIARKRFRGKGAVLSAINTSFGGIPLGEDGLMVGPNLAPFYMPDRSSPTGPGQISVTLSSDQVNQIAQSVAQGARAGTMQGVSEGSEAAQRKKERRNTLTERIQ